MSMCFVPAQNSLVFVAVARRRLAFALLLSALCVTVACQTTPSPAPSPAAVPATAPVAGPATMAAVAEPNADAQSHAEPHPDIPIGKKLVAYVGPRFITGERFVPEARAVVVDDTGRVRALLRDMPAEGTYPLVTLPGAVAVPGLADAHVHLLGMGRAREELNLLGVTSTEAVRSRVRAYASKHPDRVVVRGRGFDQTLFANKAFPTAADLDGATDKPVMLVRIDGHAAWVNAQALALAGITKDTPDPDGGKIVRDAAGVPTGMLIDNAMALVEARLPPHSDAELDRFLRAGLNACVAAGLTSVHEMGLSPRAARRLVALDQSAPLPLRVFVYLDGSDDASLALLQQQPSSARVTWMGIKLFADGAMGSRGAALFAPYSDAPDERGLVLMNEAELSRRVAAVHALGFAAAVHAIGDRGNAMVLDVLAQHPPKPGVRDRIEHAQLVRPEDFARFASLGVVASMQPTHATSDKVWLLDRVGAERAKGAYAWRTMLEHGVMLAFGSDAPVESEDPRLGLYAAITRQDVAGQPKGGFLPEQRLSEHQALVGFTQGAAFAVGQERELGALTPGMKFDVTLFESAPTTPAGWPKNAVVGSLVQGVPAKALSPVKRAH